MVLAEKMIPQKTYSFDGLSKRTIFWSIDLADEFLHILVHGQKILFTSASTISGVLRPSKFDNSIELSASKQECFLRRIHFTVISNK